jgi:hypothetical protein
MGVVIPFPEIKRAKSPGITQPLDTAIDAEEAITLAVDAGSDRSGVLAAARPLLEQCRDHYGFVVMRDGLPSDPAILGRALLELLRGLLMLDAEMGAPRKYPIFGVYYGHRQLAWFEDGYSGATGLAVPNDVEARDLIEFLRPRVAMTRVNSQE